MGGIERDASAVSPCSLRSWGFLIPPLSLKRRLARRGRERRGYLSTREDCLPSVGHPIGGSFSPKPLLASIVGLSHTLPFAKGALGSGERERRGYLVTRLGLPPFGRPSLLGEHHPRALLAALVGLSHPPLSLKLRLAPGGYEKAPATSSPGLGSGRGERIRTSGLYVPNVAL